LKKTTKLTSYSYNPLLHISEKEKEKRKRKKKEHSTFFVKEFGSSRMNVIKLFVITIFVAGK
jgi:hypothetical protein